MEPAADERLEAAALVVRAGRILAHGLDVRDRPSRLARGRRYHDSRRTGHCPALERGDGMAPIRERAHARDRLVLDPIELLAGATTASGGPLRRRGGDGLDRLEGHAAADGQPVLRKRIDPHRRQRLARAIRRPEPNPWMRRTPGRRVGSLSSRNSSRAVTQVGAPLIRRARAPPGLGDRLAGDRDFESGKKPIGQVARQLSRLNEAKGNSSPSRRRIASAPRPSWSRP